MFGNNKKKKREDLKAKEKLANKLLHGESGRRVFGFRCVPYIKVELMKLAGQLNVPLFVLSEHAIELGMIQIKESAATPEEREALLNHLTEVHIADRTEEKVTRYDKDSAEDLSIERRRRFAFETEVRKIVAKFWRFAPNEIEELVILGYKTKYGTPRQRQSPSSVSGSN